MGGQYQPIEDYGLIGNMRITLSPNWRMWARMFL